MSTYYTESNQGTQPLLPPDYPSNHSQPDAYPPQYPPQQPYPVQQYQDNAGVQHEAGNFTVPNQMPYDSQPPPPYDIEGVQPLTVHVVVQEQPRTIAVRSYPNSTEKRFIVLSVACVVLSVLCCWPSLICSIPALICSIKSYDNFSRGDFENGRRQRQWCFVLNLGTVLTSSILVVIVVGAVTAVAFSA